MKHINMLILICVWYNFTKPVNLLPSHEIQRNNKFYYTSDTLPYITCFTYMLRYILCPLNPRTQPSHWINTVDHERKTDKAHFLSIRFRQCERQRKCVESASEVCRKCHYIIRFVSIRFRLHWVWRKNGITLFDSSSFHLCLSKLII